MTQIPTLTGGIFFTLILEARKQRLSARDTFGGQSDGLSDPEILKALIRVIVPDYLEPAKSTFKQNTSEYKSCRMNGSTYIPFTERTAVDDFSTELATDFDKVAVRMNSLINSFLEPSKLNWLIRAVIETIEDDSSIPDGQTFQVGHQLSVAKKDFSDFVEIDAVRFLTGVFGFIILERPDNRKGEDTYSAWMKKVGGKNSRAKFDSSIGTHRHRTVNLILFSESVETKINETTDSQTNVSEPDMEIIEPEILDDSQGTGSQQSEDKNTQTASQTMNLFNQFGNGNTQIGSVGTFINK